MAKRPWLEAISHGRQQSDRCCVRATPPGQVLKQFLLVYQHPGSSSPRTRKAAGCLGQRDDNVGPRLLQYRCCLPKDCLLGVLCLCWTAGCEQTVRAGHQRLPLRHPGLLASCCVSTGVPIMRPSGICAL